MKKTMLILIVLLVAANGGCNGTSQERLDGLVAFLGMAKEQSKLVDDDIAVLQQTLTDLQVMAKDPALAPSDADKIAQALSAATEQLSVALDVKERVDGAVAAAEAALADIAAQGNATIGDEIKAAGAALVAVSPTIPPPFGIYVGMFGTLLGAVGGVVAKRKNDVLVDVVKSVDRAKDTLDRETAEEFTKKLRKQDPTTIAMVRKIRG